MEGGNPKMARIKKINKKLGNPGKTKNPYLKLNGGIDLVEKFVGIDYMPYEKKIKRPKIKRS